MTDTGIPASPARYRDDDIDAGPLILEMHRIDGPDKSPMQMVSGDLLAYYRRCEVELVTIKAASQGGAGEPDILDACTVK
ncbi:hypothetical protein F2P44_21415 [Massilia sp. CCM 8695]|uniref:Uncharacterized protein n=1 Tax=Massilia frigida TaxID=2609281 RepID=A0ABX0NHQ4_9BURK|nr:hypothetical protein [Massilia frigida]NHZ81815.1 hypothetical protein [Massilia frigida]